jgi:pSer/pThr/pTyr-binding forkhead associated (FHA) protein
MWILQGSADEQPVLFRLRQGAVKTVGRAPGADLILDAALVSRVHCRLEAGDDAVQVVDLSSTNGTFVNDQRVARGTLTDGDRLRIGRVELQLGKSPDSPNP